MVMKQRQYKGSVRCSVEEITPEIAREWLKLHCMDITKLKARPRV